VLPAHHPCRGLSLPLHHQGTARTLVLPNTAINTNGGSTVHQKRKGMSKIERLAAVPNDTQPGFAFHAVGCSPKCAAIRQEMTKWGVAATLTNADVALFSPRTLGEGISDGAGGSTAGPIGDDGIAALAATIKRDVPQHLTYLALNRNGLGPRAAPHVREILLSGTPLQSLDLSHNEALGDDGVRDIMTAVVGCVCVCVCVCVCPFPFLFDCRTRQNYAHTDVFIYLLSFSFQKLFTSPHCHVCTYTTDSGDHIF
jgi:hypothetical protein